MKVLTTGILFCYSCPILYIVYMYAAIVLLPVQYLVLNLVKYQRLQYIHSRTCTCTSYGEKARCNVLSPSVPDPTSVSITPGIVIAGSQATLTCVVELPLSVDVPVTVNTMWTGPDEVTLTPTNPVPAMMMSLTRYTSTSMVDAARSGNYTCKATVTSSSQFIAGSGMMSGTTAIIVGKKTSETLE